MPSRALFSSNFLDGYAISLCQVALALSLPAGISHLMAYSLHTALPCPPHPCPSSLDSLWIVTFPALQTVRPSIPAGRVVCSVSRAPFVFWAFDGGLGVLTFLPSMLSVCLAFHLFSICHMNTGT